MSYIPAWLRLSAAVDAIVAATGCSREEAQFDICQAIADGTVKIQGKLKKHIVRGVFSSRVLQGTQFQLPSEIKPANLDWENSCPHEGWAVHYEVLHIPGHWELEWIELFRTDVTTVLCAARERHEPAERTTRSRPSRERAQKVIEELYPQSPPSPADLPNALLCRRVGDRLKELRLGDVSDDTILRVAGRRRK
jgi:hypothetical protein